jgi:hypothetical protein
MKKPRGHEASRGVRFAADTSACQQASEARQLSDPPTLAGFFLHCKRAAHIVQHHLPGAIQLWLDIIPAQG